MREELDQLHKNETSILMPDSEMKASHKLWEESGFIK